VNNWLMVEFPPGPATKAPCSGIILNILDFSCVHLPIASSARLRSPALGIVDV
jgi:hypothetical protein